MDIDLGKKTSLKVKVDDKEYDIFAPTVLQAQKFQENAKKVEDGDLLPFINFLQELGLPKDVTEFLDIHQFKKLSDGLLGMVEKK